MKELLMSKGFKLKQYPDGLFWVWTTEDRSYMDDDYTILQCTESFRDFTLGIGGYVYKITEEEFLVEVNKI